MMRIIDLSLDQAMITRILQGCKICHTAPGQLGNIGDRFVIADRIFRIVEVFDLDLSSALSELFRLEGFETREDFSISWLKRFSGSWDGCEGVHAHFFGTVTDP